MLFRSEEADPSYRKIDQFYEVWNCAGLRLMENSFDMAHLAFTHRGTFGPKNPVPEKMTITEDEWGLETYVETPVTNPAIARNVVGSDAEETVRIMRGRSLGPTTTSATMRTTKSSLQAISNMKLPYGAADRTVRCKRAGAGWLNPVWLPRAFSLRPFPLIRSTAYRWGPSDLRGNS